MANMKWYGRWAKWYGGWKKWYGGWAKWYGGWAKISMHSIPLRNRIKPESEILNTGAETLITRAIISTNAQESCVWSQEVSNGI
jgi:hypothetical protein